MVILMLKCVNTKTQLKEYIISLEIIFLPSKKLAAIKPQGIATSSSLRSVPFFD